MKSNQAPWMNFLDSVKTWKKANKKDWLDEIAREDQIIMEGEMPVFKQFVREAFKTELEKMAKKEFERGVQSAADVIRAWNSSTIHAYDLGDCILAKLNMLPTKKIRKNKSHL